MDINYFTEPLAEICGHSLVAPGRSLACTVIVNPVAGGFAIHSRRKSLINTMNEYRQKAQANPAREMPKKIEVKLTEGKGSAEKIAAEIIKEAEKNAQPFYLIISAGGDGTHWETMYALYHTPAHVRSNIAVLRLPLGTGNDGADCAKMAGALDLLINPVHIEFTPAVQLITSQSGPAVKNAPYLAFNILSVGLDAYVTHMTNKLKGNLPGDSYKLWLDIATLFYETAYKIDYMDIRALDQQNREIKSFREKMLLIAVGASGHRTYGSQELILPDDRNVCAVKKAPLHRKLILKGQVSNGKHVNNKDVILLSAHRVEFSGKYPILAQMDGESILLQPEDFPAAMELTAPVIPLLKKNS
jgi:diacylglycerol kinase family enzyme